MEQDRRTVAASPLELRERAVAGQAEGAARTPPVGAHQHADDGRGHDADGGFKSCSDWSPR